jgi:uncharacterized membrane protein YhfC
MDILPLTYFLNGLLMIAIPLGLAIFLTRRWKAGWGLWGIGAVTFILSQVGHIPFNLLVQKLMERPLIYWPQAAQTAFWAVFGGLSAGVFEEGARYLALRFWARGARSWRSGVLFGAGHGGAEAILIGFLALATYFFMLIYRQADLATIVPASQLEAARQQLQAYWSVPWYASLLGALERVFALACQVAMAVMVMQVFIRRNWLWLGLAVLYHAAIDGVAVVGMATLGMYWTEALVSVFALASLVIIFALRRAEPSQADASEVASPPLRLPSAPPETAEKLEETRYTE